VASECCRCRHGQGLSGSMILHFRDNGLSRKAVNVLCDTACEETLGFFNIPAGETPPESRL